MNHDRPHAKAEPHAPSAFEEKAGTSALGGTAGAIGGALVGAMGGLVAGPVGSLAGALGGAVAGGLLGAATGGYPPRDSARHAAHWQEHYASRPYVPEGAAYDDYEPAYRYGIERYLQTDHPQEWHEVQARLHAGWNEARGTSRLDWAQAEPAVREAWERMLHPPAGAVPPAPAR